jgi:predicted transcriptional regulator
MSKPNMAEFLQLGERTVYRSLNEAQELGLIERGEHGLRATDKWIRMVEIYDIQQLAPLLPAKMAAPLPSPMSL